MDRVKPLKWRRTGKDEMWGLVSYAQTAHGYYIIANNSTGYYVGMVRGMWEGYAEPHSCKTIDAAKAWAERQHKKEVSKWLL